MAICHGLHVIPDNMKSDILVNILTWPAKDVGYAHISLPYYLPDPIRCESVPTQHPPPPSDQIDIRL